MTRILRLSLKGGERIFVNGAVMRVDRKVSIELLNDVKFLLEGYVMQEEAVRTPLQRIYFLIQTMLIDPAGAESAQASYREAMLELAGSASASSGTVDLLRGMGLVAANVECGRHFDALRELKKLIGLEHRLLVGAYQPLQSDRQLGDQA